MNWFGKSLVMGAVAGGLALVGCVQPPANSGRSSSSGSLALSSDDSVLYAVDTDNGTLSMIDTKTDAKIGELKVGERPARVVVGTDDTIYVTNRGSNTVSVIRKGDTKVSATIDVGTEPVGIAVAPDNKTLYVVNATAADNAEYGSLTGIDVATLTPTFEIKVGAEPRGIALLGNDRAVITLYKAGELVEVDLKAKVVASNGIGIYNAANLTRVQNGSTPGFSSFQARALGEVVATPDGTRVFAPTVWARQDPIGRRPTASGGYYSAGGPCNVGAVATAGLVVADQGNNGGGSQLVPQVDDLTGCVSSGTTSENKDFPTTALAPATPAVSDGDPSIQGPVAAAVDPTGTWVFVVNKESKNVAVLPAFRRVGEPNSDNFSTTGSSVRALVAVGAGADGIALTRDGNKAYVYSQFEHNVSILGSKGVGSGAIITTTGHINVTSDVLSPEVVDGRKMFFDATNPKLSAPGTNVSCGTCHLEGLDDSHVWSFPDGPRQTPALAGRHLTGTAPYHWSGEYPDLATFLDKTIRERMGGSGLADAAKANNIAQFIEALPSPKNANVKGVLTDAQTRGAQVFASAQCGTCHSGANFTNNTNHDVGTLVMAGKDPDNGVVVLNGLNVPSLLGLARTAPYLHDGSALTLEDRLSNNPGDKHGVTSNLTDAQRADLVAYLKTL